ncbi:MAG: putative manganese-dependent inorganic diphosphatase [Coriobacteriia bacterium]|nr:putative manganese-dependent inorganic diphosphatase [Coriobacteriia bacterium]
MAKKVYVVGHKNPDNDSICSAVAYAYLKNESSKNALKEGKEIEYFYEPVRLGPLPPETKWLFKKYDVPTPRAIRHVYGRVRDVMTRNPITIKEYESVVEAGRIMRQTRKKSLIVVDKKDNYKGLITTRMIAERYISATDKMDKSTNNIIAVAADLIKSLDEKAKDMMETDVLLLSDETLLKDAIHELLESKLREAVILDKEKKRCVGILTRSDVANPLHKNVILVDHNEASQAANGIDEAKILEIIDHHRIADISTLNPIKFMNLPVGSTASIVASEFENYKHSKIPIPKPLAAALLSAIITDTVILNSPTTTAFDRRMAKDLAAIVGVDIDSFGHDIFDNKSDEESLPISELVGSDSKVFQLGDQKVLIAQHETIHVKNVMKREKEIRQYMSKIKRQYDYEFVLFMITDIIEQGSLFLVSGNIDILNRVFHVSCTGHGGTWMPGIVSRKLQVAPRILGA